MASDPHHPNPGNSKVDVDTIDGPSPERSALMARVRGKDTKPELIVRSAFHGRGLRFRLHRRDLPGTPDLIFPRHRLAVFVHGCFWHRHESCRRCTTPKTRTEFWNTKFRQNIERDQRNLAQLQEGGWRTATIWECQASDPVALDRQLQSICSEFGLKIGVTSRAALPL